jgi:hypothetical protein
MDQEVGYAAGSNTVLARAADRRGAIVLRALTAFTTGHEAEIVFMSREPVGATEFETWTNLDTSETGPKLGFTYTAAMPRLHIPRLGALDDEPPWHPSGLWGGVGGDPSGKVIARNLRVRLIGPAPSDVLTIGWSWLARGITADSRALKIPTISDVEGFTASIRAET